MSFFSDLGDSITGKSKTNIINNELGTEQQIANAQLANDYAMLKLQNDPEVLKQKRQTYTIIGILIAIVCISFIKHR